MEWLEFSEFSELEWPEEGPLPPPDPPTLPWLFDAMDHSPEPEPEPEIVPAPESGPGPIPTLSDATGLTAMTKQLEQLGDFLQVAPCIQDRARGYLQRYYVHCVEKTGKGPHEQRSGRGITPICAALLFLACRQEGCSRSFVEVAAHAGVRIKRLNKSLQNLRRALSLIVGFTFRRPRAEEYLPRLCGLAHVPYTKEREAVRLLARARVPEASQVAQAAAALLLVLSPTPHLYPHLNLLATASSVSAATLLSHAYKMQNTV